MPRWIPVLLAGLCAAGPAHAAGLLVPSDRDVPPLAMVRHDVQVTLVDQAAVTQVTQVFRNHTDRALEATYIFPVPKGASVSKFTMWVDGKEVAGEMVEADKARQVYTDIVRRAQDPGLLEYMGNDLLRLRVFPVPAHGDQKLMVRFSAVAAMDSGLIEYTYPLKTDGKAATTLEKFTLKATLKSQHKITNVYSPTHPVTVKPAGDHETTVSFEQEHGILDRDFQLFYSAGDKDVGLTAVTHRPVAGEDGCFMLLVSPRAELSRSHEVPRDMVFVLDTSGSMQGVKMEQAKKALKFCLNALGPKDRFAVMNFATTVNWYADGLRAADHPETARAKKWVEELQANGGTAIDAALGAALDLRPHDDGRPFTLVFFTDGQPTVGETNPETILKHVKERHTSNTRIFTFGVGDDVNAAMLDKLADETRAVSTYVRPEEDIEVKVSGLYAKISHPVLTDLKLSAGSNVTLREMYPNHLPDLFHGGQLVVLGRYTGKGHTALTLTGRVGAETREFVYEVDFPAKTGNDRAFVEDLWARRKVGYLLDQIRQNGQQKELTDEVVKLAKKHGIATPFTSYLVVPDNAPLAQTPPATVPLSSTYQNHGYAPQGLINGHNGSEASRPMDSIGYDRRRWDQVGSRSVVPPASAAAVTESTVAVSGSPSPAPIPPGAPAAAFAPTVAPQMQWAAPPATDSHLNAITQSDLSTGKTGVDLAIQLKALRSTDQLAPSQSKQAAGRRCVELGGVWVDAALTSGAPQVKVKALSAAYFRMLERHPELKEVFALGSRVVWMTPSGTALVIDAAGAETLSDDEIDKLFSAKK
jgi:Ca-activated chloride channel family protein